MKLEHLVLRYADVAFVVVSQLLNYFVLNVLVLIADLRQICS